MTALHRTDVAHPTVRRLGVLCALGVLVLAGCGASTAAGTGTPVPTAPSPTAEPPTPTPTSAPTPTPPPTPEPTPDIAAIGDAYVRAATALSQSSCEMSRVVGTAPTLASWQAGLRVEIAALDDALAALRAISAPPAIQGPLDDLIGAVEAWRSADEQLSTAPSLDVLNAQIDAVLVPAIDQKNAAAQAARSAIGLPPLPRPSC